MQIKDAHRNDAKINILRLSPLQTAGRHKRPAFFYAACARSKRDAERQTDQKNPALISMSLAARNKDTTRPTPQNMAMVLRVSTSTSVPGNAYERTLAIAAAICDLQSSTPNDEASPALVAQPARGRCEAGHTTGQKLRRVSRDAGVPRPASVHGRLPGAQVFLSRRY